MAWLGKKNCHEDCSLRIMDYLTGKKKGKHRAIGFDCFNFALNDPKLVEPRWAGIMDSTRMLYGNHTDWGSKRAVKYYHFVISPDPRDEVDLETLRKLTATWVTEMFGGDGRNGRLGTYEAAVVYHDDNTLGIPHAHIVVNNTNLVTERRLQISDEDNLLLGDRLQVMAKALGLSHFSDDPTESKKITSGRYMTKSERRLIKAGGYSWKQDIANNVMVARRLNRDEKGFVDTLEKLGVDARVKDGDYVFTHKANEERWKVTGYHLGKFYTREHIMTRLDENHREYTEALEKERDNALQFLLEAQYDIDDLSEVMNHAISVRDAAFALQVNEQFQIRCLEDYQARIKVYGAQLLRDNLTLAQRNEIEDKRNALILAENIAEKGNFFKDTDLGRPTIDRYKKRAVSQQTAASNDANQSSGGVAQKRTQQQQQRQAQGRQQQQQQQRGGNQGRR